MARTIQQSRFHGGFDSLDQVTQYIQLSPASLPVGSTVTRLVGEFSLHSQPGATNGAGRILYLIGLGVTDTPAGVNVSTPDVDPDMWLWWSELTVTVQTQWIDASTQKQNHTGRVIPFDVRGQRILGAAQLYVFGRLFGDPLDGLHTSRISVSQFYKLPA